MTEKLLQYIWQFQYFSKGSLATNFGEQVEIISAGRFNLDQGPDFSEAKIRIGDTTWVGMIELHHKTSEWIRHRHGDDPNYNTVILHVVWENDEAVNQIPVLELKDRVSKLMLDRYETLMNSAAFIPCAQSILKVPELTWSGWKDRLVAERLTRKSGQVKIFLEQNKDHWEETFWWMLARNFGTRVNSDAFEAIARSIPLNILARHKNQLQQVEALLFGQAGLLRKDMKDAYAKLLYKEYHFLKKKYGLKNIFQPIHFLRMRPGNFPTIRLAQLAVLISQSAHLFSRTREACSLQEIKNVFNVTANDYWHYHYRFDTESSFKLKTLGDSMIDNILINTITPVLFAYGTYHDELSTRGKAIQWLLGIQVENNRVIAGFEDLGIKNRSAFDSQALLELKKEYCDQRRCLECAVGNSILREESREVRKTGSPHDS